MTNIPFATNTVTDVNLFLKDFFDKKISQSVQISPTYERLWKTIADNVLSGGKRLRPILTVLAFEHSASKNETNNPIAVASSQELLHSALLIHDDIIDRDTIRHGKKNINGIYKSIYAPYVSKDNVEHYAHSASILAGDLLIAAAHEAIAFSAWDQATKEILLHLLENSIFEVAGGELLDIEATFIKDKMYKPETIYRYKTAGYSFIYPLLAGATMANADKATKDVFIKYGTELGIAYQLQDDLLGVFGDKDETGKSTTCDLREAKQTVLVEKFLQQANKVEGRVFGVAFGNINATHAEVEAARKVIERSGAKSSIQQEIIIKSNEALYALKNIPETESKQKLKNLVDLLMVRRK